MPSPPSGPRPPLEVHASFAWRLGLAFALFALFALPLLIGAIVDVVEGVTANELKRLLLLNVCVSGGFAAPLILVWRVRAMCPRRFDATGVTRFDGKLLPWSEFRNVGRVMHTGRRRRTYQARLDLVFASGSTRVPTMLVKNLEEVLAVVEMLERRQNPWAA